MNETTVGPQSYHHLRDLSLVAALVTRGFEIIRIERVGARCHFIFADTKSIRADINRYWANELVVSAREYAEKTKMLKSRIYSELGL